MDQRIVIGQYATRRPLGQEIQHFVKSLNKFVQGGELVPEVLEEIQRQNARFTAAAAL